MQNAFVKSNTYIDESVETFLKLSMKTVQVHLIIGTTLSNRLKDENAPSYSLLTFKCELLLQMTKQSYPSLFTLTIGFIVCNSDCKPMSLVKN